MSVLSTEIPNHLKYPPCESDEDREQLDRLNELAIREGWQSALEEVHGGDRRLIRYVTEPARFKFLELLPLTKDSTVLEIGAGMGNITVAMAPRVGFVHALEVVPGQCEFIAVRCRQEGVSNVAVACGGDDCRLPYDDGKFDGIVVNLVLEWCGGRDLESPLLESQRRFLAECRRVLKPGGWFYLTTKNRYRFEYLLGGRDEHTFNWRFGQALPRWLLDRLLRFKGKSRPGGLIHSYPAMTRLLTEAGFSKLRPYWAVPEFREPREYVPADGPSIRAARRRMRLLEQGLGPRSKLMTPLVPAPLLKYVMPGLVFLAERP